MISKNSFKTVSRGFDTDTGCEVSWNTFHLKNLSPSEINEISAELKNQPKYRHANIIHTAATWVNKFKKELVIILENISGNSLNCYLSKIHQPKIKLIKAWCRGILQALDFLHSQSPPIIYGELTPKNVYIIPNDGIVKLKENYLDKLIGSRSYITGSIEYLPPEMFLGSPNTKSDIYSFGLTLLEICTQQVPFQEHSTVTEIFNSIRAHKYPQSLLSVQDPEICEIITSCLDSPDYRPTAKQLLLSRALDAKDSSKDQLPIFFPLHSKPKLFARRKNANKISLVLINPNQYPKEIMFEYNTLTDSPESVAVEMVEEMEIERKLVVKITEEIFKKIEGFASDGPKIKIFRYCTDTLELNTANDLKKQVFEEEDAPQALLPVLEVPQTPVPSIIDCWDDIESLTINENFTSCMLFAQAQLLLGKYYQIKSNFSGFAGKKSFNLVKKFQQQQGLRPDGKVTSSLIDLISQKLKIKGL